MAHYAQLDSDNRVVQVFVGRDDVVEGIDDWETYYAPQGFTVRQTSYNTHGGVHYTDGVPSDDQTKALRFNYAAVGYTFDPDKGTDGAFIPPKPFESWVLDEDTCLWEAPTARPELEFDEFGDPLVNYGWDEDSLSWVEVSAPA